MNPRISIPRLRKAVADKESAHAAVLRANANYRDAREELRRAGDALARYDDSAGAISAARIAVRGSDIDHRARYVRAVEIAQEAVNAAEAAQEAASEAWQAVAPLATSAIAYARNAGQLPADLEDH